MNSKDKKMNRSLKLGESLRSKFNPSIDGKVASDLKEVPGFEETFQMLKGHSMKEDIMLHSPKLHPIRDGMKDVLGEPNNRIKDGFESTD